MEETENGQKVNTVEEMNTKDVATTSDTRGKSVKAISMFSLLES